jgi:hypothetical protein
MSVIMILNNGGFFTKIDGFFFLMWRKQECD